MANLTVQMIDSHNDITNSKSKRYNCIDSKNRHFVVDWNENINGLYPHDYDVAPQPEAMAFWCNEKFEVTHWDDLASSTLACPEDAFHECVRIMHEKGLIE